MSRCQACQRLACLLLLASSGFACKSQVIPNSQIAGQDGAASGSGASDAVGTVVSVNVDLAPSAPPSIMPPASGSFNGDESQWQGFFATAGEVERALTQDDGSFVMKPHTGGGTSAYVEIWPANGSGPIGAFLPQNSATQVTGEIFAFSLARFLGYGDNVQPATQVTLTGAGLQKLRAIMQDQHYSGDKEVNRQNLLKRIEKNPTYLVGAFKDWTGGRPIDYDAIRKGGGGNGTLNTDEPTARLLLRGAPAPDANTMLKIGGGEESAVVLAKQLSTIMVIDALNLQWDRYSGGNLHIKLVDGRVAYRSLDNGGTATSLAGLPGKYLDFLVKNIWRFDAAVVDRVVALDEALAAGEAPAGFADLASFQNALGMRRDTPVATSEWDKKWTGFVAALKLVAPHLRDVKAEATNLLH